MSSLATVADADLVARCRRGDQEAWDELVNRFSRYVYAIAIAGLPAARATTPRTSSRRCSPAPASTSTSCATTRRCGPGSARSTRRLCVDRLRAGAREAPAEETLEVEGTERRAARSSTRRSSVHEAMKQLPGALRRDPRPLLRPGRELPHDRRGPRHPAGHDRQPHLPLPAKAARRNSREENRGSSRLMTEDADQDDRDHTIRRGALG